MTFKFSSILPALGKFFAGIFTKNLPSLEAAAVAELASVEQSIIVFAKTDLGKLAIDAVSLATGATNADKFAAAKALFIADAKTAGHDLTVMGSGVVDWMIQTAYTFAAGVITNATAG
jgi:hypothetical protein